MKASIKASIKNIVALLLPNYNVYREKISYLEKRITELEAIITECSENNFHLKNVYKETYDLYLKLRLKYESHEPGSPEWLVLMEHKYGGKVENVKRNKVSIHDPRSQEQLSTGGMIGGDRMGAVDHNYASLYSKYLKPFLNHKTKLVLIEVGVLKGTGMAIWSDLFPKGRIIGLDIDLGHFMGNYNNLKKIGAFKNDNIELYEFDQFKSNRDYFSNLLKRDRVNIIIDDGNHLDDAILKTMNSVLPFLSDKFVYVIEDNESVYKQIKKQYKDLLVNNYKEITFIVNN